jgi:addiction module HigA family antidote
MKKTLHPVHPGEVLSEEFLKPMNLSQNRVALSVGVPARRINEIVLGKRGISGRYRAETGKVFWDLARILVGLTSTI